jgi:hypothetical protein
MQWLGRRHLDMCMLPGNRQRTGRGFKRAPAWKIRGKALDQDIEIHAVDSVARNVRDGLESAYDACFDTASGDRPLPWASSR